MPLAVLADPFDHDDVIFELKYDGFRALADVGRGRFAAPFRATTTNGMEGCISKSRPSP